MKKILKSIIILILFIFTNNIYAATVNISASKTTAYVGDSVTINVSINAAAWNLNVSGNGVNGGAITGFNMEGINQITTKSYILNTNSVGTYVVSLKGDISDGATDVTSDVSQSVTVTIKEKQVVTTPSSPATTPSTNTNVSTNKPIAGTSTNTNKNTNTSKLSNNAYLSQFRIDQPGMSPSFNKNIYDYAVTVGEDVQSLNVTAIAENNNASVSILGNTNLNEGDNIVTIKVTAQDKKNVKTYRLIVTKTDNPEKSNAYLQSIYVDNAVLTPEFSPEVLEYSLGSVKHDINNLKISAFPENENAKVEIVGNENLILGENNIKIIVTSENGEVQKTYILKVTKEESEESSLMAINGDINNQKDNSIWSTLKDNATILLLYLFVWIEFIQVVYLYERLKKVENVDIINKDNVQEETHIDKYRGIIKRIKIWKKDK